MFTALGSKEQPGGQCEAEAPPSLCLGRLLLPVGQTQAPGTSMREGVDKDRAEGGFPFQALSASIASSFLK